MNRIYELEYMMLFSNKYIRISDFDILTSFFHKVLCKSKQSLIS